MATLAFSCYTSTEFVERTQYPSHPCWGWLTYHTYVWPTTMTMTAITFTLNLTSGMGRWYVSTNGTNWLFMGNLSSTSGVDKTWTTSVANIQFKYIRFEGVSGYVDKSTGTITYTTTPPPPPACDEGTYKDITCWDGSVIHDEVCLCPGTCGWWKTGNTCPTPPVCTEGEGRSPFLCADGVTQNYWEVCQNNAWVDNPYNAQVYTCPMNTPLTVSLSPVYNLGGYSYTDINVLWPPIAPDIQWFSVEIFLTDPNGVEISLGYIDVYGTKQWPVTVGMTGIKGVWKLQARTYDIPVLGYVGQSSNIIEYDYQCNTGDMTDTQVCFSYPYGGNNNEGYTWNYCQNNQWVQGTPCPPCNEGEGTQCSQCTSGDIGCAYECHNTEQGGIQVLSDDLGCTLCHEGNVRNQTTCWDGSLAGGQECVGPFPNEWVPIGTTCPEPPICTEGEVRNQTLCTDGMYAGGEECVANQWLPIDTTCSGEPLKFPWWLLLVLGGGAVVAMSGKDKKKRG